MRKNCAPLVVPCCVIGLDQSYTKTAIAVCHNVGSCCKICSVGTLKGAGMTKTQYRQRLTALLGSVLQRVREQWPAVPIAVVYERPRLHSQGHISTAYLLSIGGLNAAIIDFAAANGLPCYSVDTRAWRSAVVGTAKQHPNKKGIPPEKYYTVKHFCQAGYADLIKFFDERKKKTVYDHDIADAMGIAMSCCVLCREGRHQLLKQEG